MLEFFLILQGLRPFEGSTDADDPLHPFYLEVTGLVLSRQDLRLKTLGAIVPVVRQPLTPLTNVQLHHLTRQGWVYHCKQQLLYFDTVEAGG